MECSLNVPSEEDWRSEELSLDAKWAYAKFHGKTLDEAVRLFNEDVDLCQEDLMYMPSRVLPFYLTAFVRSLLSETGDDPSDGARCFLNLIGFMAQHRREDLIPLWSEVEPVLKTLAERQNDFDVDWLWHYRFWRCINEIVQRGFAVSFDTAFPEVVPQSVTLAEACLTLGVFPFSIAAQILRNSGFDLDATTKKPDILRILGVPDATGGGEPSTHRGIAEWIRFDLPSCAIRFEVQNDCVTSIMFCGYAFWFPKSAVAVEESAVQVRARENAIARWQALFAPSSTEKESSEHGSLDQVGECGVARDAAGFPTGQSETAGYPDRSKKNGLPRTR